MTSWFLSSIISPCAATSATETPFIWAIYPRILNITNPAYILVAQFTTGTINESLKSVKNTLFNQYHIVNTVSNYLELIKLSHQVMSNISNGYKSVKFIFSNYINRNVTEQFMDSSRLTNLRTLLLN